MSTVTGSSASQGQSGGAQAAMSDLQQSDSAAFAKLMKDAQSGDGNSVVEDALKAYQGGAISKGDCKSILQDAQQTANAHGGGVINKDEHKKAAAAMGENDIANGKTRGMMGFQNAFENFTGIGQIYKGIKDNNDRDKPSTDLTINGQNAVQTGSQTALQDMAQADPDTTQKFQQDAQAGDGNAMVDDLVAMKGKMPDGEIETLASQIQSDANSKGKGAINKEEHKKFLDIFGVDTIANGKTKGQLALDKVGNFVSGTLQSIVSPVTGTVNGTTDLIEGDTKGALSQYGQAAMGAVQDAAMVVAPEAAPEIEAGAMAARAGADGAEAAGKSGMQSVLQDAGSYLGKANDYASNAYDASNLLNGTGTNNDNSTTAS